MVKRSTIVVNNTSTRDQRKKEKQHVARHAVFLFQNRRMVFLVVYYLSKIIIHNITPSAFYDATTAAPIASNFFPDFDHFPDILLQLVSRIAILILTGEPNAPSRSK